MVPVSGKPAVEPTFKATAAESSGTEPVTAAETEVFLNLSLKPLNTSSVKEANFTVASSRAAAALVLLAPLVTPVKVVAVLPV